MVTAAVVALVAGLALVRLETRLPVWRDQQALLAAMVRDAPGSYRAEWAQGAIAHWEGELNLAEHHYLRAAATQPLALGPWVDLAALMEQQDRWADAGRYHAIAFGLDSNKVDAALGGVAAFLRAGMAERAVPLAGAAERRFPDDYRVQVLLGALAMARGQPRDAVAWRRQVAARYPQVWQYWYLLADAALAAGDCAVAAEGIGRVRALEPAPAELAALEERVRGAGCEL